MLIRSDSSSIISATGTGKTFLSAFDVEFQTHAACTSLIENNIVAV